MISRRLPAGLWSRLHFAVQMTAYAVHPSVAHVPDLYKPDPVVVQQAVDEYEEADADGEPEDDVLIA